MGTASDVLKIEIQLVWEPVRVNGEHRNWHKDPPLNVRDRDVISGPKVYRWVLLQPSGAIDAVYIGQSGKFQKRVSNYRKGKGNARKLDSVLQKEMRHCEECDGKVELHFLDLNARTFSINGKPMSQISIGEHDVRLLIESIAVVEARLARNVRVLNRLKRNPFIMALEILLNIPETMELIKKRSGHKS